LKAFDLTLSVMQEPQALERVALELAEDAHLENVRYMEIRYCPALHLKGPLKLHETVDAVLRGLSEAGRRFGIQTGTIICGIRHLSPELSLELADLAVAYNGRGVVGFDLAGAEKDYPAKAHREAFDRVLRNNVNVTVHAGEAFGPQSIRQVLLNGFKSAFVPYREKGALLRRAVLEIDQELERVEIATGESERDLL